MLVLIARKLCCCHCHGGEETLPAGLIIVMFIMAVIPVVIVVVTIMMIVTMMIILPRGRIRLAIPAANSLSRTRLLRGDLVISQLQLGIDGFKLPANLRVFTCQLGLQAVHLNLKSLVCGHDFGLNLLVFFLKRADVLGGIEERLVRLFQPLG